MVGAGTQDKTPVVAVKSPKTKKVKAKVTKPVSSITLQRMVQGAVEEGSTVYTDHNTGYKGLAKKNYKHESVNHSVGEYIKDQAHTNGVESFWSMMKRGYVGVYHQMSEKHLQRYVVSAKETPVFYFTFSTTHSSRAGFLSGIRQNDCQREEIVKKGLEPVISTRRYPHSLFGELNFKWFFR